MKELIIKVDGMHCEGCENRIKNVLMNVSGVDNVLPNHNNGTVTITLNKEVDMSKIIEEIEDIGFEVKE